MKLARREKLYLYLAIISGAFYIVFQFVVFPLIDQKERIQQTIQLKHKEVNEVYLIKAEYDLIKQKAESAKQRFASRTQNFRLYSFLNKLAEDSGIKNNIDYMKPSTTKDKNTSFTVSLVELKLNNITTEQLMNYLYRVETSNNNLSVRKMSVTETKKNEGYINVVLQVVTLETS